MRPCKLKLLYMGLGEPIAVAEVERSKLRPIPCGDSLYNGFDKIIAVADVKRVKAGAIQSDGP